MSMTNHMVDPDPKVQQGSPARGDRIASDPQGLPEPLIEAWSRWAALRLPVSPRTTPD